MRLASPWSARMADVPGPVHERLAAALADDIAQGVVPAGARLPSHRDLAYRLRIGLVTVTRAYALLERRGLVKSERGRGMFVAGGTGAAANVVDMSVNTPPQMLADRLLAATFQALAREMDAATFGSYHPPMGSLAHRRTMARWLSDHRMEVPPDRLLITNGAQHALAVAFAVALGTGGRLFTEAVTYPGAISLARHAGIAMTPVALDDEGLRADALDAALAATAGAAGRRAVYVTPSLHNPTGASMAAARRADILRVCRAHDVLVVEDDIYSLFAPRDLPTLADLMPERTFYVNGLSKTLNPGLRLGLLAVPPAYLNAARAGLQATCSMASPISCAILERWVVDGTAVSIGTSIRMEAAWRMALARETLPELRVPCDHAGFHAWLPMPLLAAERTARRAATAGVILTPPTAVMPDPDVGDSGLRLCLGGPSRADLSRALTTLRNLLDSRADEGEERSVAV